MSIQHRYQRPWPYFRTRFGDTRDFAEVVPFSLLTGGLAVTIIGIALRESAPALLVILLIQIWFQLTTWRQIRFTSQFLRADIILSDDDVVLRLPTGREIAIPRATITDVKMDEYSAPMMRFNGFPIGDWMTIYFISSPTLPDVFSRVSYFYRSRKRQIFRGRGFFITSRHEGCEAFLAEMRQHATRGSNSSLHS